MTLVNFKGGRGLPQMRDCVADTALTADGNPGNFLSPVVGDENGKSQGVGQSLDGN
jgi:hypothetical protein